MQHFSIQSYSFPKIILAETNVGTFNTYLGYEISFLILFSWLRNHVQSQQQRNKVRFGSFSAVGWLGVPMVQVVFGGFCSLRWYPLVSGGLLFNNYINFTAYRTLNSLLYSWLQVIEWDYLEFFIQSKTARKKLLLPCHLAVWKEVMNSYILLCSMPDKKLLLKEIFWKDSYKTQSK